MRRTSLHLLLALTLGSFFFTAAHLRADSPGEIRQLLSDQESAWNRGDVTAFMQGYDDSPQTTFIGKSIQHGYQSILRRYQRTYSSRAAMGHLDFGDLQIRMLSDAHAVVTGSFHLTRSQAAGGDASGVFSLVLEKKASGWKIILDHTSS